MDVRAHVIPQKPTLLSFERNALHDPGRDRINAIPQLSNGLAERIDLGFIFADPCAQRRSPLGALGLFGLQRGNGLGEGRDATPSVADQSFGPIDFVARHPDPFHGSPMFHRPRRLRAQGQTARLAE